MSLPKPEAIIFDWDNTLVNTWPIIHAALNATMEAMGKPLWSIEQTKNNVSKSMRDSFPIVFGEDWQKAATLYQGHYRSKHLENLEALPMASDVLAAVSGHQLFTVVVSNKRGPNLRQEVEHMGWQRHFANIVGADDAKRDKPFIEPVEMAFEKSGIAPGRHVWFIGDSEVDLECAMNAGCTGILYGEEARAHPEYSATHYRGFPYHAHVHNHAQTMDLLKAAF